MSTPNQFEIIKKSDPDGQEYWSSRELSKVLEYSDYRKFLNVIEKAKEACVNAGGVINNHFVHVDEMVVVGSGAERRVDTILLSRYACYLIVQNSNPTKVVVAKGQNYFAIQTRKQEVAEELAEDHKRLHLREEMKKHNAKLQSAAASAGVITSIDYAIFQNHGYKGLYGGLDAADIKKRKRLKKSQQILDHMGSEELAANLFRATQTEAKIKRERIDNKTEANLAHYHVGEKVRNTIRTIGGTMPENLPTPDGVSKAKTRIKKSQSKKLKGGDEN